ncbi:MAG: hypothetical protein JWR63_1073 [Conexibacter sp.]|nr:hypothetical protein [Conexibacter sp.]
MPIFKKRTAQPPAVPTVPDGIDPITGLPWLADRYRPEPLEPTGHPVITGTYAPGEKLRRIRRQNGAAEDDLHRRGRGYSGGGSGWGGIR